MKKQYQKLIGSLCSGTTICLMALQGAVAQTPVDASDGIDFGGGIDDPAMGKSSTGNNLDVGLANGSAFKIFSGGDTAAYFKAGEGNEATVTSGKWYRIAQSGTQIEGMRTNATFSLRDNISSGGHSTATFRVGMSYGDQAKMAVTLLSHSYFMLPSFTKIRVLDGGTYDVFYLEVWMNRSGAVRYSISDNLSHSGWEPVDWTETTSIPTGYTSREYNIDKLFMVGDSQSRFSIARGGSVEIDGTLNVLSSPVITQATAPSLLAGYYVDRSPNNAGSGDSLLMEGTFGGSGSIPKQGAGARMMWYPEKAAFRAGNTTGTHWDDSNTGNYSTAFGSGSKASGQASVAMGYLTEASGDYSFAVGDGSVASNYGANALGVGALASGSNSLAVGFSSASGTGATSFGTGTADGDYSFAVRGTADAGYSIAMGGGTTYGFSSFAALNGTTTVSASEATSIGAYSQANSMHSLALGMGSHTYGDMSAALAGANAYAYRSVALGINSPRYTEAGKTAWQGDDQNSAFEVGIGDWGNAKNGLTVLQDGSVEVGKATATDNSVPLHIKADGSVILSQAQGDISMGDFGN